MAETYEEETIKKLQKCDAFSIGIDESEVNKKSELLITATIATKEEGIENVYYKSINLEGGDIKTITDSVFDTFTEDKIEYMRKMVDVGSDCCATMLGYKTGVLKRMMDEVPQLRSTGSCNSHNVSNTMQHSTEKFDSDMKPALTDLYYDIGGAKGKGLKKKKEFEETARNIEPVLHNFLALVHYYKSLKKPTERQKRLQAYFVDRCDMSMLLKT